MLVMNFLNVISKLVFTGGEIICLALGNKLHCYNNLK